MDAVTSHEALTPSQPETVARLAQLSDGEKISLLKIAKLYARHAGNDHQTLLREAFTRVLTGTKVWPKEAGAIEFITGVLRGVAWGWKSDSLSAAAEATGASSSQRDGNAVVEVDKIIALFDGDETARKLVVAMLDGAKGEALSIISGLDKAGYESKRAEIRCRIENFFATER